MIPSPTSFSNLLNNPILLTFLYWTITCLAILIALHIHTFLAPRRTTDDRVNIIQPPWPVPKRGSCDHFKVALSYGREEPRRRRFVPRLPSVREEDDEHAADGEEEEEEFDRSLPRSQHMRNTARARKGNRKIGGGRRGREEG